MSTNRLCAALLLAGAAALAAPLALPALSPAEAAPRALLPSFSGLVEATRPAVVTIRSTLEPGNAIIGEAPEQREGEGLRDFFRRFFGNDQAEDQAEDDAPEGAPEEDERPIGLGSGFIVDPDGVIVTNNHVVGGSKEITVELDDGTMLDAQVVAIDEKTDLAVLRVETPRKLPTVTWGDSDEVKVGDWAIAIGNPFGLGPSVNLGIISASGRNIHAGPYDDYFQIDAPINRGNSGGPLFDQEGRVIGVNTAIFSPSGGNVGIGFAMPSNQARAVVDELLAHGHVERGWLGVAVQRMTPEVAESVGTPGQEGALVAGITEGGPAAQAGLKTGDLILNFGGTPIETLRDLSRAVAEARPGTKTTVRVLRDGRELTLPVGVGRSPS